MAYARPAFIGFIALLAIISAVTLGLKASTLSFIASNNHLKLEGNLIPPLIWIGAARHVVVSSTLNLFASLLLLVFAVRYWPDGHRVSFPLSFFLI